MNYDINYDQTCIPMLHHTYVYRGVLEEQIPVHWLLHSSYVCSGGINRLLAPSGLGIEMDETTHMMLKVGEVIDVYVALYTQAVGYEQNVTPLSDLPIAGGTLLDYWQDQGRLTWAENHMSRKRMTEVFDDRLEAEDWRGMLIGVLNVLNAVYVSMEPHARETKDAV